MQRKAHLGLSPIFIMTTHYFLKPNTQKPRAYLMKGLFPMKFTGPKYITSNANHILPLDLQINLWQLIQKASNEIQLDYLQIFRLEPVADALTGHTLQRIEHEQEVPPYKEVYLLPVSRTTNGKVYVIDSQTYCTMMMDEDY